MLFSFLCNRMNYGTLMRSLLPDRKDQRRSGSLLLLISMNGCSRMKKVGLLVILDVSVS